MIAHVLVHNSTSWGRSWRRTTTAGGTGRRAKRARRAGLTRALTGAHARGERDGSIERIIIGP